MSEEKKRFAATFEFASAEARDEFVSFMCESGEQSFFDWQESSDLAEEQYVQEFDYWCLNEGKKFGPRVHAKSSAK
jgi:hypothetical protein